MRIILGVEYWSQALKMGLAFTINLMTLEDKIPWHLEGGIWFGAVVKAIEDYKYIVKTPFNTSVLSGNWLSVYDHAAEGRAL